MRGEKWRHLPHVGHATDGPVADVLVKGRRLKEHATVRRHAAQGMRKKGKEGRTLRQVTIHGCAVAVAVALASGSCADGISGMTRPYGCGGVVAHSGACSDGHSGHLTSEDRDGGQKTATRHGDKRGTGGGDGARV